MEGPRGEKPPLECQKTGLPRDSVPKPLARPRHLPGVSETLVLPTATQVAGVEQEGSKRSADTWPWPRMCRRSEIRGESTDSVSAGETAYLDSARKTSA